MKKLILLLLVPVTQLVATPIAYEGFSNSTRQGWDSPWRIIEGDAQVLQENLTITNFNHSEGFIQIGRDSGVVCDIKTPLTGKFYGSYRASCSNLVEDSLIALTFQDLGADELHVKDAPLSISLKGWKLDHGSLKVHGSTIKYDEISSIESGKTYLVLWKIENITDASTPYCMINAWTLNEEQATYFASNALNELALSEASIGKEFNQVTQRVSHRTKNGKLIEFANGVSVGLVSRFGPEAVFDELTLSRTSLADATGASTTVSSLIER